MLLLQTPTPEPAPIPWLEIATIVVASLAFLLSFYSYYRSHVRRFVGLVIPERRISLTWVDLSKNDLWEDVKPDLQPCVLVECIFINEGAAAGKLEDVVIKLVNLDKGGESGFAAFLIREESVDLIVDELQPEQDLREFSTIWLRRFETRYESIFFKPTTEMSMLSGCKYRLELSFTGDGTKMPAEKSKSPIVKKKIPWKNSPVDFLFKIEEDTLNKWKIDKETVRLDSIELEENRKKFFTNA